MAIQFELSDHTQISFLQEAIKDKVDVIAKEEIAKAQDNIKSRVSESLACLPVKFSSEVDLMRDGQNLKITVKSDLCLKFPMLYPRT
tara:strand:+ start:122 stop:382 length:261 start_codon:yes stop_codon:yes gene_type:complete